MPKKKFMEKECKRQERRNQESNAILELRRKAPEWEIPLTQLVKASLNKVKERKSTQTKEWVEREKPLKRSYKEVPSKE